MPQMVNIGAVVTDAGVNRLADGVGSLNGTTLLESTIIAAERSTWFWDRLLDFVAEDEVGQIGLAAD